MVRELFLTYWTNFAKIGKPSDNWTSLDPNAPLYMEIKTNPEMVYAERYAQRIEFWMNLIDEKSYLFQ